MALHWKLFVVSFLTAVSAFATPTETKVDFKKEKITIGDKTITVEMAESRDQHERGLMFRKSLPENQGMLFVFEDESVRYFWMKNTIIDLSIGYFDKTKTLIDIQEMTAASVMEARPRSYPSAKPAMYALEMTKGWFAKNNIKVGQKFEFTKRRQ